LGLHFQLAVEKALGWGCQSWPHEPWHDAQQLAVQGRLPDTDLINWQSKLSSKTMWKDCVLVMVVYLINSSNFFGARVMRRVVASIQTHVTFARAIATS
jgi:hypothetical protein